MTLLADNAHNILRAAINSEVGIRVIVEAAGDMVTPTARAKQVLYRFKQEDYEYKCLQIEFDMDEPDRALWIIKREMEPQNG